MHSQLKPKFQGYMEEPVPSDSFQKNKWYLLDSNLQDFSLDAAIRFSKFANVIVIGNRKTLLDRKPDFSVPIIDGSPVLVSDVFVAVGLPLRKRFEKKDTQTVTANSIDSIKNDLALIVADDDLGNKELYMAYFEDKPWKTEYAMNGQEAYDLYLNSASDVLILDVRMPLMDGFEVAAKVRGHEQENSLPIKPIILVTADALTETVDRASKVPGVTFLTKPIRKSVLFDSIGKALNKS
jgi:CheY-like chemotaxis protein